MEQLKTKEVLDTLSIRKIWLPLLLGIAVPFYLFTNDETFTWASIKLIAEADRRYMALALLTVIARDLGYVLRLRILTHGGLSWLGSFYIIMLWEFSSAVTPSVVGGSVIAIFLLTREGMSFGKSLAYVLVASTADNLCFIIAAFFGVQGFYGPIFTGTASLAGGLGNSLQFLFWSSSTFLFAYTAVVLLSLLCWPTLFRWVLVQTTNIPFLKRWQPAARQHGDEIVLASNVLQAERPIYWLKVGLATLLLWGSKYLIVNFIVASYVTISPSAHWLVFGKQLIMWTVMLVSPTPGSSGTAEFFYQQLHGDMLGGYTLITVVIWRSLTSYYYLIIGAIVLPHWIRRVFPPKRPSQFAEEDAATTL